MRSGLSILLALIATPASRVTVDEGAAAGGPPGIDRSRRDSATPRHRPQKIEADRKSAA